MEISLEWQLDADSREVWSRCRYQTMKIMVLMVFGSRITTENQARDRDEDWEDPMLLNYWCWSQTQSWHFYLLEKSPHFRMTRVSYTPLGLLSLFFTIHYLCFWRSSAKLPQCQWNFLQDSSEVKECERDHSTMLQSPYPLMSWKNRRSLSTSQRRAGWATTPTTVLKLKLFSASRVPHAKF